MKIKRYIDSFDAIVSTIFKILSWLVLLLLLLTWLFNKEFINSLQTNYLIIICTICIIGILNKD